MILKKGEVLSDALKIIDMLSMQDQFVKFSKKEESVRLQKEKGIELVHLFCELGD